MEQLLTKLRISSGLTKKQLAEHLDIPVSVISQFEKYPLSRNYLHLVKLANYFHIQADSLLHNYSLLRARAQYELLQIYQTLDDRSKGILLARACSLAGEGTQEDSQKKTKNYQSKWKCH